MKQAERMKLAGKSQVLLWLSAEAKQRLERLAAARATTQVSIVESALLALEESPEEEPSSPVSVSVPGGELAEQITRELAELNRRVSLLENGARTALNGAGINATAEPLSYPSLEENGARTADSGAVVALESRADILAVSNEDTDLVKENPDLAALIASIPKAELVSGGNEQRNRRILELHLEGMGTTQISRVLIDEGIPNSKEASVTWFLKKNQITPNKINRRSK